MCELIYCFIKKGFKKNNFINCGSGKGNKIKDVLKILMKELKIDLKPKFNNISDSNPSKLIANIKKAKSLDGNQKKIYK